jgi:SAM-dependent methyltransferase
MTIDSKTHERINDFYREKLSAGGTSPKGVDFNSPFAQQERFRQLLRIVDTPGASLLDYGCGYGELLRYLMSTSADLVRYMGYDVSDAMIAAAKDLFANETIATFESKRAEVKPADFVVGSGLFNISFMDGKAEWLAHIETTIDDMAALAVRGFSFNMLTAFSDPERMRDDLTYGDPHYYFDYCRKFSRHVSLIHDYELYDFTILVRKILPS